MKRKFHPDASQEAADQADYYSQRSTRLGPEFLRALKVAVQAIEKTPDRYPFKGPGTRVFRMKRFPVHIYYRHYADGDMIMVYAVAHTKRRPGYWHKRLEGDDQA